MTLVVRHTRRGLLGTFARYPWRRRGRAGRARGSHRRLQLILPRLLRRRRAAKVVFPGGLGEPRRGLGAIGYHGGVEAIFPTPRRIPTTAGLLSGSREGRLVLVCCGARGGGHRPVFSSLLSAFLGSRNPPRHAQAGGRAAAAAAAARGPSVWCERELGFDFEINSFLFFRESVFFRFAHQKKDYDEERFQEEL